MRRVSTAPPAGQIHANFRLRPELTPALLSALVIVVGALLALASAASAATPRAYEMVSPLDSNGQDVSTSTTNVESTASSDGESVLYLVWGPLPGSKAGGFVTNNVAYRGLDGWDTDFLSPLQNPDRLGGSVVQYASEDMRKFAIIGPFSPQPAPDASEGTLNLFHLDVASDLFKTISVGTEPEEDTQTLEAVGASKSLDEVVFQYSGEGTLVEGSEPAERQLYLWDESDGSVDIVGRAPGTGAPMTGKVLLASYRYNLNPVSDDGSRIFFSAQVGEEQKVLVRINGSETKDLTASQRTVPDPVEGVGKFRYATADGSVAFFTTDRKLTDDAIAEGESHDLYRYEVDSGQLTDLTVEPLSGSGAEVIGVLAGTPDGSRIYFVARGVLAPGGEAGANNVYMWTDDGSPKGSIEFVAPDVEAVSYDTPTFPSGKSTARTTPDGSKLLFTSDQSLTGYPTNSTIQGYLYDAETGELSCVSCNPRAEASTAKAEIFGTGDLIGMARTLSNDGSRVFFTSPEQLVAADEDSGKDTYEYETASGQLTLLSSGLSNEPSPFQDASADGRDVFFATRDALVPIDTNETVNLYDARIGGGLASQNPPPPPIPCGTGECQSPLAAAPPVVPGSATFQGPGNRVQDGKHIKKHKKRARKHKRRCRNGKKVRNGKTKRGKRCVGKRHGRR